MGLGLKLVCTWTYILAELLGASSHPSRFPSGTASHKSCTHQSPFYIWWAWCKIWVETGMWGTVWQDTRLKGRLLFTVDKREQPKGVVDALSSASHIVPLLFKFIFFQCPARDDKARGYNICWQVLYLTQKQASKRITLAGNRICLDSTLAGL